MLQKLKDISAIVLIPAVVLYLFGFISVTAYLARFGIITFDVVNARFLIAGVFPLLSLAVAIYIAWWLYSKVPPKAKFWPRQNWRVRAGFYIEYFSSVLIGSIGLAALFTAVTSYTKLSAAEVSASPFDFFGDSIGGLLRKLPEPVAHTLYYAAWTLPVVVVVVCGFAIQDFIQNRRALAAPAAPVARSVPAADAPGFSTSLVIAIGDILGISIVIGAFFASGWELRAEIYDFASFRDAQPLNYGLSFAWFYVAVSSSLLFFIVSPKPSQPQISMDYFLNLGPGSVHQGFYVLLIPTLTSLFVFGTSIFPRIPFAIGGGQPREVILEADGMSDVSRAKKLFLIGESGEFLFLVDADENDPRAFQVNKHFVRYLQTAQGALAKLSLRGGLGG